MSIPARLNPTVVASEVDVVDVGTTTIVFTTVVKEIVGVTIVENGGTTVEGGGIGVQVGVAGCQVGVVGGTMTI